MVLTQEQRLSGISEKGRTRFRSTAPFSREPYTVLVAVTYGPRRKDLPSQDEKLAFLPPLTILAILASVQNRTLSLLVLHLLLFSSAHELQYDEVPRSPYWYHRAFICWFELPSSSLLV